MSLKTFYNTNSYVRMLRYVADHGRWMMISFFGTWLVSALVFGILESFGDDPKGVIDSLYCSAVTMTTAGYGDILPTTDLSKLFTIAKLFWSVLFIIPLTLVTVIEAVKPDVHKNTEDEQNWEQSMLIMLAEDRGFRMGVDFPEPPPDY